MARKKNRIVHNYEPREDWWNDMAYNPNWHDEDDRPHHGGTHGASGVGDKATRPRHARATQVTPGRIFLLLLLVALILGATLLFINDLRGGTSGGDPNATVAAVKEPAEPKVNPKLPSPDSVKRRLERAGYEVSYLVQTYDRTGHGYDVAETKIDDHKAQILAFDRIETTRNFVNVGGGTGHTLVWGKLWAINFGQNSDLETKRLAEDIAGKLDAKFYWTPEGD